MLGWVNEDRICPPPPGRRPPPADVAPPPPPRTARSNARRSLRLHWEPCAGGGRAFSPEDRRRLRSLRFETLSYAPEALLDVCAEIFSGVSASIYYIICYILFHILLLP